MKIFGISNTTILLSCFLSSCVIKSTQLDSLINIFDKSAIDISENSWLLIYGRYKSEVYAVSVPDGIIFSNNKGDRLFFNGWMITRLEGLGRWSSALEINDSSEIRTFRRGKRLVATHKCEDWMRSEGMYSSSFTQVCEKQKNYVNRISLTADGYISVIRQIVDEKYTVLTLTKLN